MALPTELNTRTVLFKAYKADGTPETGKIDFQLEKPIQRTTGTHVVTPFKVPGTLDSDGAAGVTLALSSDDEYAPATRYKVDIALSGWKETRYIVLDETTPVTVDLLALLPADAPTAGVSYLTPALGDLRYVRTVNGAGPDGNGNVTVEGGSGAPPNGSVTNATVATGAAISLDKTADSATRLAMTAAERTKLAQAAVTGDLTSKADLVGGVVPTSQLPALAISDVFPVADEAAMLALVAQRGDVAVRADTGTTFILAADDPGVVDNWVELSAVGAVQSVNGQQGPVVLSAGDVGAETPAGAQAKADAAQAAAEATAATALSASETVASATYARGDGTLAASDGFGGSFASTSFIGPPYLYKHAALAPWVKARGSQVSARAEVLYIGDSTVAGIGSDNSASGTETTASILNSVPGQVRAMLAARTFIDPGEGLIMPTDTRWSFGGGAALNGGLTASGPLQRHINLTSASQTATLQLSGTDFEVWWYKAGALAAPSITIDGNAVTVAAGANGQNKIAIPAVADGSHTVVITGSSAGTRLSAAVVRRNPTRGIGVHRMGIGGTTADIGAGGALSTSGRADLFAAQFTNLNPALVMIQFGINDWLAQVAPATYKANLQMMIGHVVTTLGKCVLLIDANETGHDPATYSIKRAAYSQAMRELCDENSHVAYLSFPSLLGTYEQVNGQGLMSNLSHPNAGGYSAEALGLERVLNDPRLGLSA